ncbi:NfeD family protein [Desulfobacca acetoxidans]
MMRPSQDSIRLTGRAVMYKAYRRFLVVIAVIGIWLLVSAGVYPAMSSEQAPGQIYILTAAGSINPGLADFILEGIRSAEKAQAEALVVQLDTPGGLDTAMRRIVQGIINAKVPVVVYVAPKGARAASAGLMITLAAHISAMAPGTNIGAAHPVAIGTQKLDKVMGTKVINDMVAYVRSLAADRGRNADWAEKAVRQSVSVTAGDALKLKVIDVLADDLPDLLKKIDGRSVRLTQDLKTLKTAKAPMVFITEGLHHRILKHLADPNIAMILMMVGLAGLYFELAHPGVILPGVIGGICLLLAFYAFQTLPVNFIGILLIILAFIFFLLEIYVTSYGMLSIAGIISLALGGMMLYRREELEVGVSLGVLLTTVVAVSVFFLAVAYLAMRAQLRKPLTGMAGLVGERGVALIDLNPNGKILVHGEYWEARAEEFIPQGEPVEVVQVDNLNLLVRRVSQPAKGGV